MMVEGVVVVVVVRWRRRSGKGGREGGDSGDSGSGFSANQIRMSTSASVTMYSPSFTCLLRHR